MDLIKIEKFQYMKRYNRRTFFHRLIYHILTTVAIALFLSCPLWLPKLISSVNYLLFVFIPAVRNAIFSPKCLFFVCNVIVVFLLNESKRSESGPLKPDIYDEYVEESKSLTKMSGSEPKWVKQEEKKAVADSPPEVVIGEEEEEEEEEEGETVEIRDIEGEEDETGDEEEEEEEEDEEEMEEEEEEEEGGELSADELKKKFEDFIARINEQRRIEARMLICKNS